MGDYLRLLFIVGVLWQQCHQVSGQCCETKVVEGDDPAKAGHYYLAMTSFNIPDFCIGGCVYKKKDDENPGSLYCFKDGDMSTTCGGDGMVSPAGNGSCAMNEKMMKKMMKMIKESCRNTPNQIMMLETFETVDCSNCYYNREAIWNVSTKIFDNPDCEGKPNDDGVTVEPGYPSCYNGGYHYFFLTVFKYTEWSIYAEKEGYYPKCVNIGRIIPRSYTNYQSITLDPIKTSENTAGLLYLNTTWTASPSLFPDLLMQSNPFSCYNDTYSAEMYGPGYGSCYGSGGGSYYRAQEGPRISLDKEGNIVEEEESPKRGADRSHDSSKDCRCSPNCEYTTWAPDFEQPCQCRGVKAGGLKFDEISYDQSTPPFEEGAMVGSMFWEAGGNTDMKYFTIYAEFQRRSDTVELCSSSLTFTLSYPSSTSALFSSNVPCIPPQVSGLLMPPPQGSGSGSGYEGSQMSGSGYMSGYGSNLPPPIPTIDDCLVNFNEVAGVLVFGGSDRFWIASCMVGSNVDTLLNIPGLFTYKEPSTTPGFCGCLYSLDRIQFGTEPTNEEVMMCYCEACYMEGQSYSPFTARSNGATNGREDRQRQTKKSHNTMSEEERFEEEWLEKKMEEEAGNKKPRKTKKPEKNLKNNLGEISDYQILDIDV